MVSPLRKLINGTRLYHIILMPYAIQYITISRVAFGSANFIKFTHSHLFDEVILSWSDKLNLDENPATLMR